MMTTKNLSKRKISSGIVVVRKHQDDYLFLLLRAYANWGFPKGGTEPGENLLDTALRETEEETTITPDELNFNWGKLSRVSDPYGKGKSKIAVYFLAETDRIKVELPINPKIGKPEHDEYGWFTHKEAQKLLNQRVSKILDWANEILGK